MSSLSMDLSFCTQKNALIPSVFSPSFHLQSLSRREFIGCRIQMRPPGIRCRTERKKLVPRCLIFFDSLYENSVLVIAATVAVFAAIELVHPNRNRGGGCDNEIDNDAHPTVKHYKGKIIINWSDLGVLCGNDKVTGSHAATATKNIFEIDRESFVEESNNPGDRPGFVGEGSTKKKKKRSGGIDTLAEAISSVASSMDKSFLGRHTIAADMSMARAQAIYVALGNIPPLQKHELLKAMDILSRDTTKFGVFMTLPDDLKLEWLRMQLN